MKLNVRKLMAPFILGLLPTLLVPVVSQAEETYGTGDIASMRAAEQREALAKRKAKKKEAEAQKQTEVQKQAEGQSAAPAQEQGAAPAETPASQ